MKLPLSWIQEIIDLNLSAHKIADVLTLAGLEVDGCNALPLPFENVVVGEVIHTEPHPDAEKLCIATVSDGEENFQVVCGASNCRKGLKTAFAKVGAVLEDGSGKQFKIKKTKLRGVESYGMLCSEKELGLGEHDEGIMEFAERIKPGTVIADIYGDTIFDISLTPNLGHCANVIGVARELSAATEKEIKKPEIWVTEDAAETIASVVSVKVSDWKKCPRYACRVIKGVSVGPSPQWLQKRLLACDLRPVNNVVDVTNLVLMERGHPLHAFDYDLLEGNQIIVRCARKGEVLQTLDEKQRELTEEDLLICDQNKPVALAGVMGGLNSEVHGKTVNVLLESAYFESTSIRRTSKRFGLQTEASRRFERGSDPNQVLESLDRAAMLIQELTGGKVCRGVADEKQEEFPSKVINCRLSRINSLLGTKLAVSEVENIFNRLQFGVDWDGQDTFALTVPTYRVDINEEIDFVEEVARVYGFDNIPKPAARYAASTLPHAPIFLFEREVRSRLIAEGLQEMLTCDLVGPKLLEAVKGSSMPEENVVRVLNPTSIEQSVLRTSLMPGLMQVAKHNYDNECRHVSGFEIGRVHFKDGSQYKEQSMAGIFLMGNVHPHHWERKKDEVDFFDLKGIVETLIGEMGIASFEISNRGLPYFHPGRQGTVSVGNLEVGSLGEVHPSIMRSLDMSQRIYYAELDLHNLIQVRERHRQMEQIPVYPASDRDLTMTLNEEIPIQEVFDIITSLKSRLLENVSLIDIFRGEKVGEQKKNVTLRFVYRNLKKTVSQEAVDAEHERIASQLESRIRR
jgi:phenylalanyl-tRNA synthetase beta chain